MARPLMISKTFRLREDIVEQLSEEAKRLETSEATIMRQALTQYLNPEMKSKGFGAWKREVPVVPTIR